MSNKILVFTRSKNLISLSCVIGFKIALNDFARSQRDRDRLDRATLTGLTMLVI